ncbi:hypothetical protein SCHPADRAFT_913522 [Schizopora paradoxa]|uniref:Uncharacterized protein n=1 Tax=Schizopora paradoxa TaxID=27342 RepID=A0A0H2SKU0_9AGAM|nr:hypothetical protein SCHPADRAFT_913522 [Schizopora paradoxa]
MFVIETSLPFVARVALASTALLTSGVSTGLVGWCGAPYVATMRTVGSGSGAAVQGIEMKTFSLALRPRYTTVYDTAFLTETKRPFAKWELAESVTLPEASQGAGEETVAETADAKGNVVGRWIVSWNSDGLSGRCRAEGQIQRYYNVHEELLPSSLR